MVKRILLRNVSSIEGEIRPFSTEAECKTAVTHQPLISNIRGFVSHLYPALWSLCVHPPHLSATTRHECGFTVRVLKSELSCALHRLMWMYFGAVKKAISVLRSGERRQILFRILDYPPTQLSCWQSYSHFLGAEMALLSLRYARYIRPSSTSLSNVQHPRAK
jgi:hypothetical protein